MKGINDLKILLIEDSRFEAKVIYDKLRKVSSNKIILTQAKTLKEGLKHLNEESFDVILVDLILPDSQGLATFNKIKENANDIPFILLTGIEDENIADKAVQEGAQDFLIKGQVSGELLIRSIKYAIERHRIMTELKNKSLVDDLTGLYNRRGFFTFAEREIKLADRSHKGFLLIYADLDGLKLINDTLGHQAGDNAILDMANILREVFREADIIARIGGDEFVILAVNANEDSIESIRQRLKERLDYHNRKIRRPYDLSVSVGIAKYNPDLPCTIDELLNKADKIMYTEKWDKKKASI